MSIEVRVPKEITEYKEKILFGLSIRQLICFGSAITLGIGSYYFISKYINQNLASYIVILETIPLFALGFFKKDGFTFEKYVMLIFKHKTKISKRTYKSELNIDKIINRDVENNSKKFKLKHFNHKKDLEHKVFIPSKKERRRKRKEVKRITKLERKKYIKSKL